MNAVSELIKNRRKLVRDVACLTAEGAKVSFLQIERSDKQYQGQDSPTQTTYRPCRPTTWNLGFYDEILDRFDDIALAGDVSHASMSD